MILPRMGVPVKYPLNAANLTRLRRACLPCYNLVEMAYNTDSLLGPGNFRRIARASGYAYQHILRVLNGTKGCSFEAAIKIAAAAGVSVDELAAHVTRKRSVQNAQKNQKQGTNGA